MRVMALSLAISSFVPLSAQAIEGRYQIEGRLPDKGATYSGEVVVRRTGATYTIVWDTSAGRYVGTGLVTGPVLAVVFQDTGGRGTPGLASFAIVDNRVREGTWSNLGSRVAGTEEWDDPKPVRSIP